MNDQMRTRLHGGLVAAMQAKDAIAVKALRTALAAIANAEAVPDTLAEHGGGRHVAGAPRGLGAGDVPRRVLSDVEVADIVDREIQDRVAAAREYDALGQATAAEHLRVEVAVLESYLGS